MFGGYGGMGGYGNNPFAGGFQGLGATNRFVPGGLNSPMGLMTDNIIGGNPIGGFGMGLGGGFGAPYGGFGGYGGGYGYY